MKFPFCPHPSSNECLLEAVEALRSGIIHLLPMKQKASSENTASPH